jgi:F0F1-type ATP synthase membrane subunit b/b'
MSGMTEESSLAAVRDLEERISARLAELDQAGGPVEQARAQAQALIDAGHREAEAAAQRQVEQAAQRCQETLEHVRQDAVRRVELLVAHAAGSRSRDAANVCSAILPGSGRG